MTSIRQRFAGVCSDEDKVKGQTILAQFFLRFVLVSPLVARGFRRKVARTVGLRTARVGEAIHLGGPLLGFSKEAMHDGE
jgi:hypothetical protein